MRITLGRIEKDGLLIDYVLYFENGLKLRTYLNLPFAGQAVRESARTNLRQVIEELERAGFVVENKQSLDLCT